MRGERPGRQGRLAHRLTALSRRAAAAFLLLLVALAATAPAGAQTVSSVAITSAPAEGQNDSYKIGDAVQATVTFSEAVDVTGSPQLEINVGGKPKTLSYSSGSNSAELVFTGYTVAEGDEDTDGISIDADSVDLNGGTINASDNAATASLTHSAVAADTGHKVDGVRPRFFFAITLADSYSMEWSEKLDPLSVPLASAFSLMVSTGTQPSLLPGTVTGNIFSGRLSAFPEPTAHLRLTYTPPTGMGATPLRDLAGNTAAALTGRTIKNQSIIPDDPTGVSVTPGAGALTVSWNAVKRVDRYLIQWASGSEPFIHGGERFAIAAGGNTTSYTISDLLPGTPYLVRVLADRVTGGHSWGLTIVTGTPLDAAVSTVALTSDPGADGFYVVGDAIRATVTFNGPVDVAGGNPQLELQVGGSSKAAACEAGTAVAKIVCSYTVAANDVDIDGVAIRANKLSRNGATIRLAGTEHDAVLTHAAVAADGGHKVDTAPPPLVFGETTTTISRNGTLLHLFFFESLSRRTAMPGAFTVEVEGVSREVTSVAVNGPELSLTLASAVANGETVTVSYADPSPGNDGSAVQDIAGNDAASFGPGTMTNNVPGSPLAAPDAPANLRATAKGPRTIEVDWDAPADNGNAITGYWIEYRAVGEAWSTLEGDTGSTATKYRHDGLHPGRRYDYRVAAHGNIGTSPASPSASAQTGPGAWISQAPASVAEGEEIVIEVTQTGGSRPVPRVRSRGLVWISDSNGVLGHVPLNRSSSGGYWMGFNGNHGTVRLRTRANGRIGEGGTVTLTLFSVADSRIAGFRRIEPYTATVTVTDNESPGLRVEDAEANEADGTMDFRVHLSGAYSDPVTVDYATADRTATAGSDYTARSNTLTFAPGQTVKTVSVPILPDTVADDGERFALTLGNPSGGARIVDGEGLGTIRDMASATADPLTDFMLVDGASGHDLGAIVDGATLTLPDPYGVYGINAVPSAGAKIASVRFVLSGAKSATRTDSYGSFGVFGAPGQTLPAGSYTLTATAYAKEDARGDVLDTLTVSFTVPESLVAAGDALSGLTLTNKTIGGVSIVGDGEGEDGTEFARTEGHLFEIAAVVADADVLGSVHLELLGTGTEQRTENDAPYELFGGSGKALRAGNYTVRAIAYGNAGREGSVLQVLSRSFTLGELTAAFEGAPAGHDGKAFGIRLRFSEAVQASDEAVKAALTATGGTVVSVGRVDGRAALREVRVQPSGSATDVTVSLAATTDCAAAGAVCMADGLMLSNAPSHTVPAIITVSVADAVGMEGATADFVVRLNKASDSQVTVDYETVEDKSIYAATAGTDYTAVSNTLTFAAGQTQKTVSVALTSDTEADDGELLWLVLSNATGARLEEVEYAIALEAVAGEDGPAVARGTIRDTNDLPELTVFGMDGVESGGLTVRFPVLLTPASESEVTVDYATADGTAVAGADYRETSGTLTFAPGQTGKIVWVPVIDDVVEDSGETLTLELSNVSGATLAQATAQAVITNHDGPSLSVAPVQGLESGGALAFEVRLDRAAEETVTVSYATFDGTAREGEDYTAAEGTLEFPAGVTEQTVTVAVAADEVAEDDETLTLVLTDAVGAGIAVALATGTIRETALVANAEPEGLPTVSGTARVGEELTASVEGIADADGLEGAVFAWRWLANDGTDDTEIEGATGTSYTPVLADAGKTLKVRVTFTDDGGTKETLVSAATAPVAAAAVAAVSVGAAKAYVAEGAAAAFVLSRTGDASAALAVGIEVTAEGVTLDGAAPASVEFASGAREATLTVATADDESPGADGTVTLRIAAGTGYEVAAEGAEASVAVLDDDAAPPPTSAGVTVWEADMTVVDYENGSIGAGSVDLLANQRGSAGLQAKNLWYYAPDRKLHMALTTADAGELTLYAGNVSVVLGGGTLKYGWNNVDVDWTGGQTFVARLVRGETAGSPGPDAALNSLGVSGAALSPGFDPDVVLYTTLVDAGTASVTLSAVANDNDAVVAFEPEDAAGGTPGHQVALGFGETLVTARVTAADGETVRSYRVVVTRAEALTVAFGASSYTATEGGAAAEVAVTLSADPGADVTIPLSATPEGGAEAADYTAPSSVTFAAGGALTQTVEVTAVSDEAAESGESVALGFGELPDGMVAGTTASAAVALADAEASNTDPTGLPVISGTAQVGEVLTASADGIADADGLDDATFAWQWVSNDGTDDTDIADATGATYTPVLVDAGKTLKVRVTFTDDGGTEETIASAVTGSVAPLEVSFGAASYTATEGGAAAEVVVTLSADPGTDVTIPLSATPGGGAEAADYTAPESVTFTAGGALTQTVEVTAVADEAVEDGETVALSFGELPEGVVAGATAQATVALADADSGRVAAVLSVGDAAVQAGKFQVKAAFGEAVTGFAADDLTALRVGGDAASVSDLAEAETGRAWTAWVAAPQAGRYVVRLGSGAAQSGSRESAAAVLPVDVDAEGNAVAVAGPAVTAVSVAAPDGGALSWGSGDDIEVTLAFTEAVTVDTTGGTPSVGLTVGGTARRAAHASGTGTASLTFAYRVSADDGTVSAVTVTASSLATGGGTIRDGVGRDADLAHPGASAGTEPEAPAEPLTGFTLVDAATATDVGSIADGGAFTLDDPASGSYGIRVETAENARIGSVKLALAGALMAVTRTDHAAPWSLHGDDGTDVAGAGLAAGSYTLTATAHAEADGTGAALQTLAVSFTVAAAAEETPADGALTAAFQDVPGSHGGPGSEPFTFRVLFSEAIPTSYVVLRDQRAFAVTNGSVKRATRVKDENGIGRNDLREIHVAPSGWDAVTVTLAATTSCAATGAICMDDGRMLSNTQSATVEGPVAIDVADATVTEGPGVTLDFVVSLSRAAEATVTVDYATADGTATEGDDYTRTDGTLTFEAGQTAKTVSVPVLDDAHDDDGETMTLLLSNATGGARIRDGDAVGTIENSDAIPAAWLARFGRTVADHVVDAVGSRLTGPAQGGSHVTLGGQRIALDGSGAPTGGDEAAGRALAEGEARAGLAALADRMAGASDDGAPRASAWTLREEDGAVGNTSTMTERDLLLGSSFHLALGADGESAGAGATRWTAWGRAASSRFDGEADGLVLDGEVTTFTLGADAAWSRWLAGVAVSLSEGTGSFRDHETSDHASRGSGTLESSLTGVHPYARLEMSDRLSAWGLLGFGTGELTLEMDDGERWTTDTSQEMAAAGARSVLVAAPAAGGLELALRADAVVQRMRSDAATSPEGGKLAAADAQTSRVRLMLEGSRAFETAGGGRFTPTLEVGLRQDGGDAETGAGIEVGGGLAWTDPATGLAVEAKLRGLVAHEDADYSERVGAHRAGRGRARAHAHAGARLGRGRRRRGAAMVARRRAGVRARGRGAGREPARGGAGLRVLRPRWPCGGDAVGGDDAL